MGCIYSKAIARSMSMRDEASHGFRRSSSVVAWEELLTSDHLLSLVYSRTSNVDSPSPDIQEYSGMFRRSKSCDLTTTESNLDRGDTSPEAGSRSFHTVEEYDALVERIRKFSIEENCDCYSSGSEKHETGWKRKAIGKGIKPLEVSTIEFPDIGMSRQQRGGEQVFSPGTYVTPKFGSYNERVIRREREKEGGEDSVFSRDLVAAFEDCMQQLQDDEESILRQMENS